MLDRKLLLQHIQNRFRTVEEQNQIAEGSRGFKRTERVLGAREKEAIRSGKNPETMSAKPEGEYAQRGAAFQARQVDTGKPGNVEAGGFDRDPLRPHGGGRIGTVSRVYVSPTHKTPSEKAAEANPEKEAAIKKTDQRIRDLSDKITSYKPEEVAKRQPSPFQPTTAKDKVKGMAGKIRSALGI